MRRLEFENARIDAGPADALKEMGVDITQQANREGVESYVPNRG